MRTFIFQNAGVMDPRAITTFGVSSKENDSAIGYFGTGLKYAIAVLLRLKCEVTIWTGGQKYEFTTQKTRIRVNEFDIVHMNGEPLAFTTELGKNWEAWQALRELACNALDENGKFLEQTYTVGLLPTDTSILVSGKAMEEAWTEKDKIFLQRCLLETSRGVEIHKGQSNWIFYKGVRILKLPIPAKYTYNFTTPVELTEDRTAKNEFDVMWRRMCAIKSLRNRDILKDILTARKEDFHEGSIEFSGSYGDDPFQEVVAELYKQFHPTLNLSALELMRTKDISTFVTDETKFLDSMDQQRLKIAVAFCKRIGYNVDEYPIIVSSHLGKDVMGLAQNGRIYIAKLTFDQGTKRLVGTLIEEFMHLKYDVRDCTRSMQNLLIDHICSLGERITKRPL